jgi:CDP-2,3-bis-(O-geranylgeranyl)-sn-glycerol synthase
MLGDHTLVQAFIVLWIMMPAYLANTIAVLTGGKYPIDQEKMHSDGNRILGDGKTWSGLVGGTLGGVFIGFLQINLSEGSNICFLPIVFWCSVWRHDCFIH